MIFFGVVALILAVICFLQRKLNLSLKLKISELNVDPILAAVREQAKAMLAQVDIDKNTILEKAESDAIEIRKSSKEEIELLKKTAQKSLQEADVKAVAIINEAREQADKIAGDAYKAMKNAEGLEKTAAAMKNIIEGYGDRYIIPSTSLIDHLADDFSHTDAGTQLKKFRDLTRVMVKNGSAAECDYVEAHRKGTAIDFVLDAFNGKVDSILSGVKAENYGTLAQKIQDSFHTVNHNGSAFRNARITERYLSNRLEELKWACTVQALKDKLKEEQRQIREQMREEEKAAREIEKALKEAQKEEETLHKAMEKVRKELEGASEQQRLKYEEKLADFQQKLLEAEEKNKRALSMAQQTKRGHVYIISNLGSFGEDVIKVGMTRRLDPQDRVDELGDASVPFDFDVHAMIFSEDAPKLEKELHARFSTEQINKVNPRKEFFKLNILLIRKEIELMGIEAQWTMVAEAKEYRESLATSEKSSRTSIKAG